ncbi:hypothetical protein L211DRAFT_843294 [Terfezia boudieri ATCC MYA-4762]|uniref:Uncharacterized protein n=1 Tax=Terfezia boudieri ATCC MYA-4762 TaxID=1051890 RepID=A0A3N4L7D3_9PEZI|nr:hypothetical protein L211DRAFT_843294 [Terfezia boudieri ATCC MYA-4762]
MTSLGTSNRAVGQDSVRLVINLSHSPTHTATLGYPDALPECLIPKAVREQQFESGGAQQLDFQTPQQQSLTRVFPRSTTLSTLAKFAEDEFKLPRALLGAIVLNGWEYGSVTPYELSETITVEQMISEMRTRPTIVCWRYAQSDKDNEEAEIETVGLELITTAGCAKRAEDMLLSAVHGYRWAQRSLEYLSKKATKDEVKIANVSELQREYIEMFSWAAKALYPWMLAMPSDAAPPELSKLKYLNSPGAWLDPNDYEVFIQTYIVHQAWLPRHMATLFLPAIVSAEEAVAPAGHFLIEPPATGEELRNDELIHLAKIEFQRKYSEPSQILSGIPRQSEVVGLLWHQLPEHVIQKYLYQNLQKYRDKIERRKRYADTLVNIPVNVVISFDPREKTSPDVSLRSSHSFRVTAGAVLWGQLNTLIAGSQASGYDGNGESIPQALPGGTIIQRCYQYRCAARNGMWGVWRAYVIERRAGWDGQPVKNHLGWVVCHEDADPKDILTRAASVTKGGGIGGYGGKEHIDRDVLAVNRYDWSWHCPQPEGTVSNKMKRYLWDQVGMRTNVLQCQYTEYSLDEEPQEDNMVTIWTRPGAGRFMFVDAGEFGAGTVRAVMEQVRVIGSSAGREKVKNGPLETVFIKEQSVTGHAGNVGSEGNSRASVAPNQGRSGGKGEDAFGTYLSMPNTEYEFGWMVFSGKTVRRPVIGDGAGETEGSANAKSEIEVDELIGFVYDGIYQGLEGLAWAVEPLAEDRE